ncbi:MAG: MaoC/PaaZ C-terminal domain-containing protein [Actinomycetota bacterium]
MRTQTADLQVGDERSLVLTEDLTRTQIVQYAGASGDYNPLHTDEVFTRDIAGYPGVFAHGMLTMGMTGRVLTDWVGDGRLTRFGVRFVNQVWPGDRLVATATVTAIVGDVVEFEVVTVNQDGVPVVTGSAAADLA